MNEPEYYEALGVGPTATPDEIKRKFRALARQHHPDVTGGGGGSHESFVRISQAYEVLSDPVQRADYDLRRRDRERLKQAIAARQRADFERRSTPPGAGRPNPQRPTSPGHRPTANFAEAREARQRAHVENVLHAAEAAYSLGKLRDAARLCRTVLEQDRRNGGAYELLGDIYTRQRRSSVAIEMYTMAAQLISANGQVISKLNRLLAKEGGVSSKTSRRVATRASQQKSQAMQQVLWSLLSVGLTVMLMIVFANASRTETSSFFNSIPFVNKWTDTLLCLLVVSGWFTGVALAVPGITRAMDDELFYPRAGTMSNGLPLGILLGVVSGICFYIGAALYVIAASVQESLSSSVLLVMACSAVITGAFAGIAYFSGTGMEQCRQILLFGGNVVFLAALAGWFIGDIFRPLWA